MKTRIVEITNYDDSKIYYPQYKYLFWWRPIKVASILGNKTYNLQEAKKAIDRHLKSRKTRIRYIDYGGESENKN